MDSSDGVAVQDEPKLIQRDAWILVREPGVRAGGV
jgi:hypothetical protein